MIVPDDDPGEYQRLYDEVYQQLVIEYQPTTFSQHAIIEALAADLISYSFAQRTISLNRRPTKGGNAADLAKYRELRRRRREVELLDEALAVCQFDGDFTFNDEDSEQLADAIIEFVENTLADAEEFDPDDDCDGDKFELKEHRQFKRLLKINRPMAKKAGDRDGMIELLSGLRQAGKLELKRLVKLMDHLVSEARN